MEYIIDEPVDLDETVELLDLYDQPASSRSSRKSDRPRRDRRWGVKIGLLLGLAASLAVALGLGRVGVERLAPMDLRGIWVTDVAKYAGRAVQISAGKLLFYQGDSTKMREFEIHAVHRRTEADGLRVELEYGAIDDPYTLALTYRSSEDLRLVNQPEIQWTKQATFPTLVAVKDSAPVDTVTGKMSELPPELIYCITQVTKESQRDKPVSCETWMANQRAAMSPARDSMPAVRDTTTWVDDPWVRR